jgi:hypothetical protein
MEDEDIYDFYDEDDLRICSLSRICRQVDQDLLRRLSNDSQYFCPECGRVSSDPLTLCSSVSLKKLRFRHRHAESAIVQKIGLAVDDPQKWAQRGESLTGVFL